ncbi:MAG: zinc ribbon domain-containing protein, partial [Bacteroidota bacterium]
KGETYEGSYQPIIEKTLFKKVQSILKQNSRPRKSRHKHVFPFTDLLKCGECGCSITAQYAKGNGGTYIYYRCSKKKQRCYQGYVREDIMLAELRKKIQSLILPKLWLKEMDKQVSRWQSEGEKNLVAFGSQIETKIEETETKLDKLVNGFLDGLIDKESYLKKKDELIQLKMELSQKRSDFSRKGMLWVEPLRGWLEALAKAEKLASSNDLYAVKSFLGKIGTNRIVKDKKVLLDFVEPFNLILDYGAQGKGSEGCSVGARGECGDKKRGQVAKSTKCPPVWARRDSNP